MIRQLRNAQKRFPNDFLCAPYLVPVVEHVLVLVVSQGGVFQLWGECPDHR